MEKEKFGIFSNSLWRKIFTHRSWANEKAEKENNEKLEFLGDAVLDLIVSEYLYKRFPEVSEGDLARMRASIVSTPALAKIARGMSLGEKLLLAKGEEASGGREKNSILADTFEALVGAIYLEKGIGFTQEFVLKNLSSIIENVCQQEDLRDAKTGLQEIAQQKFQVLPCYKLIREKGPDHEKWFEVEVFIAGDKWGNGEGPTKKIAEQQAAAQALERINR